MLKNKSFSVVTGKDVNELKWQLLVENSSAEQKLYSAKWFLDIVQPDWLAVEINDYRAGIVLPRKRKLGVPYIVQPLFCQHFSLLGNTELFTEEVLKELFGWIEANFIKAHFCVNFKLEANPKLWTIKERTNCKLNVEPNFRQKYGSQIKRHLKQAEKFQFQINFVDSPDSIIHLFVNNNNSKRNYFKKSEIALLETLLYTGAKMNCFVFQELRNESGELLAGAVWFLKDKESVFFFSARNLKAMEKGFFSWMIDHFIAERLSPRGGLDFEGSDQEGLMRYYLGFGGNKEGYWMLKKKISISLSAQ
jgi:hypothetical protein